MYAGSIIPYPIEFDYSARTDRTSNEKHSLFLAKKFYKQLLSGVVIYNASEWAHEHQSKHQLLEIEKPFPKDNDDIAKFHKDMAEDTDENYIKYIQKLKQQGYEAVIWLKLQSDWQNVINACKSECKVKGRVKYLDRYYKRGTFQFTVTYRKASHYFTGESLKKFDQIVSNLLIKQQKYALENLKTK